MVTREKKKAILKLLLRVVITVTLMWIVLSRIDLQQVGQAVKTAKLGFLVVLWLLSITALLIMSFKLQLILKKLQCEVQVGTLFRASAITAFYSMFIPGLLSTGVKWYILKRHTGRGSRVLSSMIYNQTTDNYFRVLLGLIAMAVTFPNQQKEIRIICGVTVAIFIVVYILLLSRRTGLKVNAAIGYVLRYFPKIIRTPAQIILDQMKIFQTAGWAFHLLVAAVNIVIAILGVVIFICAAKAVGIMVPVSGLVWQSAAIYVLGRLPISIANLGVREYTLIGFMEIYHVGAPQAFLMSIIIFTGAIIRAIIGAVCLLFKVPAADDKITKEIISEQEDLSAGSEA